MKEVKDEKQPNNVEEIVNKEQTGQASPKGYWTQTVINYCNRLKDFFRGASLYEYAVAGVGHGSSGGNANYKKKDGTPANVEKK